MDFTATKRERNWVGELSPLEFPNIHKQPKNIQHWKVRLTSYEFDIWRKDQNQNCVFFDGASRGNHGAVGAGGKLSSPKGSIDIRYNWGLGIKSNTKQNLWFF